MKKKSIKMKLKEKLELLVKRYVKLRDKYICQYCGKKVEGVNCHASHVIPVSRDGRLAFDHINLKVLCYHDHINGWHKHPTEFGTWFTEKFPERMKYLNEQYKINRTLGPIQLSYYQELIEEYKIKIKELEEIEEPLYDIGDLPF